MTSTAAQHRRDSKVWRTQPLHSRDPRLALSLRAFGRIARTPGRASAASAVPSSSSPSPSPSSSSSSLSLLPTWPIERAAAVRVSPFPLYHPRSPWGACSVKYDPAWPQCPPFALVEGGACIEDGGGGRGSALRSVAPAHVPINQADITIQQPCDQPSDSDRPLLGPGLRAVLASLDALLAARPAVRENSTDRRFVLTAGDRPAPTSAPAPSTAPSIAPAPTTTSAPSPAKVPAARRPTAAEPTNAMQMPTTTLSPSPAPAVPRRCCPEEVPSILHMILDKSSGKLSPHMVMQYSNVAGSLCPAHLAKYRELMASVSRPLSKPPILSAPSMPSTPPTPVARSAPEAALAPSALPTPPSHQNPPLKTNGAAQPLPILSAPHVLKVQPCIQPLQTPPPTKKRKRPSDTKRPVPYLPPAVTPHNTRPAANVLRDGQYRQQMLVELEGRLAPTGLPETTHGGVANKVVYNLLLVAHQPNALAEHGPVDVRFLTGAEAWDMVEAGSPGEPVVVEREQMFAWRPRQRPIAELFRRMENIDRSVSVQVPSRSCTGDSFESRGLAEVRDRFLAGDGGTAAKEGDNIDEPWNILDLRSPLPAAVLPQFLTSENCQLLPRLRDEVLNPARAERGSATREQWNEWRDVLEWVLLSQGGHNTAPHTDSHGLATWITVQEGRFGFGWLSRPSAAERAAWMADPHGFTGGRWCFMVLDPGQTVFFNSGTVHFVFRLRAEPTLALGGHVLQWTGIERWVRTVAEQMANPHITNEDMEWSAPKYVRVVARLVGLRLRRGRVDELGGEAAVRRLLALLQDFDDTHMAERLRLKPRPRPKKKRH